MQSRTAAWPRIGQRVSGKVRIVKAGRWFEVHPRRLLDVGWGDLSLRDLRTLHETVGAAVAVVLPERRSAPVAPVQVRGPAVLSLDAVVEEAIIAVMTELGVVAVGGSISDLATIDRAMLQDAATAVYLA